MKQRRMETGLQSAWSSHSKLVLIMSLCASPCCSHAVFTWAEMQGPWAKWDYWDGEERGWWCWFKLHCISSKSCIIHGFGCWCSNAGLLCFAVEREMVQKRTFTRWINLHLEKVSYDHQADVSCRLHYPVLKAASSANAAVIVLFQRTVEEVFSISVNFSVIYLLSRLPAGNEHPLHTLFMS